MKDATVTWMCNAPFKGDAWQEKKLAEIKWHSFLPPSLLLSHKHHRLSHNLTASHLSCFQVHTYTYFPYICRDMKDSPGLTCAGQCPIISWINTQSICSGRLAAAAMFVFQTYSPHNPPPPPLGFRRVRGDHTNLQVCQPLNMCSVGLPTAWSFGNEHSKWEGLLKCLGIYWQSEIWMKG